MNLVIRGMDRKIQTHWLDTTRNQINGWSGRKDHINDNFKKLNWNINLEKSLILYHNFFNKVNNSHHC